MKLHICKALWILNLWIFFSNMRAKCQNIPWWVWFLQNLGSHWNNRHWWCRVDENLLGPEKYQCGSISSSICSSWSLEGVVSVESVGQGFTLPMSVYTVVPTGVSSYTCKHNHLTLYQYEKETHVFWDATYNAWLDAIWLRSTCRSRKSPDVGPPLIRTGGRFLVPPPDNDGHHLDDYREKGVIVITVVVMIMRTVMMWWCCCWCS